MESLLRTCDALITINLRLRLAQFSVCAILSTSAHKQTRGNIMAVNLDSNAFRAMKEFRWTCKAIKLFFGVPRAIGYHIQGTFCNERQAWEIANAHKELCNGQIGF
jgi:hypothetical protein